MYIDELFPETISYGASGGPAFFTSVSAGIGGDEDRLDLWDQDLQRFDLSLVNRSTAETLSLLAFFHCVAKGRANSFPFHHYLDGEDTGTAEPLGTGDGVETVFQLVKWYAQAPYAPYASTITKPRNGSVVVTADAVIITTGFTISYVTGLITFTTPPALGVVLAASFLFDVPVRFNADWLQIRRVDDDAWSWENIELVGVRDAGGL